MITVLSTLRRLRRREEIDADRYVVAERYPATSQDHGLRVSNLDGIAWMDAPKPYRMHRCWAQSIGDETDLIGTVRTVERCACGAIRTYSWADLAAGLHDRHPWMERNTR